MELQLRDVENLFLSLGNLDGTARAVQVAPGQERIIINPFKFPQKVTWNKVKNLGILRRKIKDIEAMKKEVRMKHNNGVDDMPDEKTDAGKQARKELGREWDEFLDTKEDIPGLLMIKVEDLNLFDPKTNESGNVIPATVLEGVSVLLEGIPS
jgi:hypothetical protein